MGGKNEAIVGGEREERQNKTGGVGGGPERSIVSLLLDRVNQCDRRRRKRGDRTHSLNRWRYLTSLSSPFQRKSLSPENANDRNRSPEAKKLKKEEDDAVAGGGGEKGEADQDLVVDDNDNDKAASAPPNGNRSPRENGGSNGDAAKKEGSTGAVSPSSARSTPASGASGGKKEEKAGEGGAALPAKLSPPAARALAGLGKSGLVLECIA